MDNNDPNNPNPASSTGALPPQPSPNPWDAPASPTPSANPVSDPLSIPPAPPPPPTNPSMWAAPADPAPAAGISFSQPASDQTLSELTPPPAEPAVNLNLSNPYLAPQQEMPSSGISQFGSGQAPAQNTQTPTAPPENTFPSAPAQPPVQDPMNTAFAPTPASDQTNPFAPPQTPQQELPPQQPLQTLPDPLSGPLPNTDQPQNPLPDPAQTPAEPSTPEVYNQNVENPQIPSTNQAGTLDLSALQNPTMPAAEGSSVSPQGAQLPETAPAENAPTDLSHLIAGDETNPQPGDVYNPPVVSDQNPAAGLSQPQSSPEEGTPPPGKHLNLTKVLLVAGIPIILIVAALSAYMILGIGKPAPESDTATSLPLEKTNQAPLTNPPQQIVAPSPSQIALPQSSDSGLGTVSESTSSGSSLPGASSSPMSAIEQAKARQAASPSPSAKTSSSTTLP